MNNELIMFDFNRTLYNPDKKELIKGAKSVLEKYFKAEIRMILISRLEKDRQGIVREMGIEKYFDEIVFVKEKNEKLFKTFLEKYNPQKVYVVGDYLYEEIRYGNMNNMKTIWIRNGKFKDVQPQSAYDKPNYTIDNISKITSIIKVKT